MPTTPHPDLDTKADLEASKQSTEEDITEIKMQIVRLKADLHWIKLIGGTIVALGAIIALLSTLPQTPL
ncbi:MAG: hypothetical protein GDA55_07135 [Cellvibrionales bacterium]|nr:hypothetical protein [Cellvibrionales bacterium]